MEPMRIYIAGPYTAPNRQETDQNVNRAIDAGIEVFNRGHFPYVPHLTHLVDQRARDTGEEMSWADFIKWDNPWLQISDALLLIAESPGANIELQEAKRLGKTIFYSTNEIPWLQSGTQDISNDIPTHRPHSTGTL